jgi:hypothetical protein
MKGARAVPVLTCAVALALGCGGPLGPFAGGRLHGTEVTEPVTDFSFAADVMLVQLEVRPERPWSVTLGCIDHEGAIYVGSDDPGDRWVQYVVADPRVRLRIGDKIYPRVAVKVEQESEWVIVGKKLFDKYDLQYEPDHDPGWLFRLDPPPRSD